MKLTEIIIISLVIFFVIVGVHQTTVNGFVNSYWIFMLAFLLFSIFMMVKARNNKNDNGKATRAKR